MGGIFMSSIHESIFDWSVDILYTMGLHGTRLLLADLEE